MEISADSSCPDNDSMNKKRKLSEETENHEYIKREHRRQLAKYEDVSPLKSIKSPYELEEHDKTSNPECWKATDNNVRYLKNLVCRRLANGGDDNEIGAPAGFEDQYAQLYGTLSQTIINCNSTNVLVLGYQGCGKRLLIRRVLAELEHECLDKDDKSTTKLPFRVVWIDGNICSEDELALEEISYQLGLSDPASGKLKAYSYGESLKCICDAMKMYAIEGTPIIFILFEFETFARNVKTGGKSGQVKLQRQSLLYALVDLTQDPALCISVVGISTNLAVTNLFETRLKSRFTSTQVNIFPPSPEDAIRALTGLITIPLTEKYISSNEIGIELINEWNRRVEVLFEKDTTKEEENANYILDDVCMWLTKGRSYGWICTVLNAAILLEVTSSTPYLTAHSIRIAANMLSCDYKLEAVKSLSQLELLVLLSMLRLERKKKISYTFQDVYDEYIELQGCEGFKIANLTREATSYAFSRLYDAGLLSSISNDRGILLVEKVRMSVPEKTLVAGLKNGEISCPLEVMKWCTEW